MSRFSSRSSIRRNCRSPEPNTERRTSLPVPEVTAALASYIRGIGSGDSRFDCSAAGSMPALTTVESRAWRGQLHELPPRPELHRRTASQYRSCMESSPTWAPAGRVQDADTAPGSPHRAVHAQWLVEDPRRRRRFLLGRWTGEPITRSADPTARPNEKRALVAFLRSLTGKLQDGRL
jgi:hypothetical protein